MNAKPSATVGFDVASIRRDFPILDQSVNGKPLVYLDNAASSQRPQVVIDAISSYYERDHANVHRGVHALSQRATDAYEGAREVIRRFINAADTKEMIYTRGTTESVNLVAQSFLRPALNRPRTIVLMAAVLFFVSLIPLIFLGKQFLPEFDESNLIVSLNTIPGTSLSITSQIGTTLTSHFTEHKTITASGQRAGRHPETNVASDSARATLRSRRMR